MTVLSTLVKTIAEAEGLEEVQVGWVARHLREAGLISSGGRGRGGAAMTSLDAATLLIGLNASMSAKDSADAFHVFGRSTCEYVSGHEQYIFRDVFEKGKSLTATISDLIKCAIPSTLGHSELEWNLLRAVEAVPFGHIDTMIAQAGALKHDAFYICETSLEFAKQSKRSTISVLSTGRTSANMPPAPPPQSEDELEERTLVRLEFYARDRPNYIKNDRKDTTAISFVTIQAIGNILTK